MDPGSWWSIGVTAAAAVVAAAASSHVVLRKRDSRAAVAWVALIWLAPFLGTLVYVLFGINRISRRARLRRAGRRLPSQVRGRSDLTAVKASLPEAEHHLTELATVVDSTGARPLEPGNRLTVLDGGPATYDAMLTAIESAQASVAFATYIFDSDEAGRRFVAALRRAVDRGVAVRVLVDAVGARYTFPRIDRTLKRAGIPVSRFLPAIFRSAYTNLRNHRKILVVDGRTGFTGGANVRAGYLDGSIRDLHFRLEGPVVGHLRDVFVEDWAYTTGEVLSGEAWSPALQPAGVTFARGITDGPDEDFENLRWTILGALATARKSVRIVTPYFLPDFGLVSALIVAAKRGVVVEILIPERPNLALVGWASTAQLWQVLAQGCRVFLSAPPFDHSKLLLVDETWALIGSSNWDQRSFRLNFECDVECYDPAFVGELERIFFSRRQSARETSLEEVDSRRLHVRLRDGVARLLSPYL